VVTALAIIGLSSHWLVAVSLIVMATMVAIHGLATGARAPSAVMVAMSLLVLALSTAG
jgi:hypothetical protein